MPSMTCEIGFIYGNQREAHKFKNSISSYVSPMTMNDEDDCNFTPSATHLYLHKIHILQPNARYCAAETIRPTDQPTSSLSHSKHIHYTLHRIEPMNDTAAQYYWITIFIMLCVELCQASRIDILAIPYARPYMTIAKGLERMRIEQTNSPAIQFSSCIRMTESRVEERESERVKKKRQQTVGGSHAICDEIWKYPRTRAWENEKGQETLAECH